MVLCGGLDIGGLDIGEGDRMGAHAVEFVLARCQIVIVVVEHRQWSWNG